MCQNSSQKQKILIVDDSEINRSILSDILGDEYDIFEAADGVEAIDLIKKYNVEISAVLLDIIIPRKDGFEVLREMNRRGWIEQMPVIIISAETGSKQVEQAYNLGATDFISRPFDALIVHRRVVNTVLLYAKQRKLLKLVIDQINEKEHLSNMLVDVLSHIVEFRNGESGQHIVHIRTFTEVMLRQLQKMTERYQLKKDDISMIALAAALHDIGKIAIDEKILNKPGRLTKEEFEVMKTHSTIGAEMLEKLPNYQNTRLVQIAKEICRWHHERYDGRGYPDGLKGDEIPISAQVVALADVYDALVSERCYKKAYSHEKAIQMILDGECGVFNPILLDCLQKVENALNTEFIHLQSQERKITQTSLIKELLHGENYFASERSLQLIDQERMEYGFFFAVPDEFQFKYTLIDDTLRISPWSTEKLGISDSITDPLNNEEIVKVVDKTSLWDIKKEILKCNPNNTTFHYECPLKVDHSSRWFRITIQTKWQNGKCFEVVGKGMDIHETHSRVDYLEKKASLDAITGLLNHGSAKEKIVSQLIENPNGKYALAIFDIDNFKSINDTYGHGFGDQVLEEVAKRLKNSVSEKDIVARIGGDEFLFFINIDDKCDLNCICQSTFNQLIGEYERVPVNVSLGIVESSLVGNDYDSLFNAADQALYSAKRAGRSRALLYNESMKETFQVSFSNKM